MKKALLIFAFALISCSLLSQEVSRTDSLLLKYNYLAGKSIQSSVKLSAFSMGTAALSSFFLVIAPQQQYNQEKSVCYVASGVFVVCSVVSFVKSKVELNKAGTLLITPVGIVVKF